MNLIVNGKPHQHGGDRSIRALLNELGARPEHTALMINEQVIPSENWDLCSLNEGDRLEMLVFVGGG